jgi:hypothetical protein
MKHVLLVLALAALAAAPAHAACYATGSSYVCTPPVYTPQYQPSYVPAPHRACRLELVCGPYNDCRQVPVCQ